MSTKLLQRILHSRDTYFRGGSKTAMEDTVGCGLLRYCSLPHDSKCNYYYYYYYYLKTPQPARELTTDILNRMDVRKPTSSTNPTTQPSPRNVPLCYFSPRFLHRIPQCRGRQAAWLRQETPVGKSRHQRATLGCARCNGGGSQRRC